MRKVFNLDCSSKFAVVLNSYKLEGNTSITGAKLRSLSKENLGYAFPLRTLKKVAESIGLDVTRSKHKKRIYAGRSNSSNAVMVASLCTELIHTVADLAMVLGVENKSDEMKRLRAIYTGMRMICNRRPVEEIENFIENGYLSASKVVRSIVNAAEPQNV